MLSIKRTSLPLLFSLLLGVIATTSYAQTSNISIQLEKVSLADLFARIEQQSDFLFFYVDADVKDISVSVQATDKPIGEVLQQALRNTDLTYKVDGRNVNIMKKAVTTTVKSQRITGKVTDSKGETIVGASVVEKGTTNATVTDVDGNYSINVPEGGTLQISYISYETKEFQVRAGVSVIDAKLNEESEMLDQIVVVGYGTQKKVNLTGAVGIASAEDIRSRPITNISTGLQGLLSGVTVVSATGLPGQSNASIRIRGIGTIGNSDPLVIVDGVEGNINYLNPEDIENISVLKDAASSSIYGARAANGVILITTKSTEGKDRKPEINFSGYYGFQMPTRLPEMADAEQYILLDMEATRNVGKPANYTQYHLDKVLDGSDPDYFSNTDWIDAVYRQSAPQQNYAVSANGKGSAMGYFLSYSYLDQEGLTVGNSTHSQRHNVRSKLNTRVVNLIDLTLNLGYTTRKYSTPSGSFGGDGGAIYTAMSISPLIPVRFTDGTWGYGGGSANPVALLYDSGHNTFESQEVNSIFTGKIDFTKYWNTTTTYSFIKSNSLRSILSKTINYYRPGTPEIWYSTNPVNKYENRDYTSLQQTLIAQTNYNQTFGKHSVGLIAGFSQEWYTERNFDAARTNLSTEKDPSLNFGSNETQTNGASASSWAIRSGFGRVNYNYAERYLLEANIRYDLTSRFHKDNRAGLFPSVSAAWRISEEGFVKGMGLFDNFKLRTSWGILGNQYVGSNEYPYLAILGIVSVPRFGTIASDGYTQTTLPNPNLHWETITMTNLGVDLAFFKNKLAVTADYFMKETKDILLKLTYPDILGLPPTEQNAGKVSNRGWEIDVQWRDRIGKDFSYSFGANLSDVRNKITDFGGLAQQITNSGHSVRQVNEPIDAFYGYKDGGFWTPQDFERYNPSTQRYENPLYPVLPDDRSLIQPGDIKLLDISGPNGVPDGEIDATYDRDVLGSSIPRYTYSFRGDVAWKGFYMNFMIQGVGKANGLITGRGRHAFIDQSTYPQKEHLDRWTFENPNPNASYPRLTYDRNYNQRFSTFWMEDASYIRLKNVQVGYNFDTNWLKKAKINNFRVYVSADNLLTISDFFYAYDPETPISSGGYYPQVKTFVLGFNITLK